MEGIDYLCVYYLQLLWTVFGTFLIPPSLCGPFYSIGASYRVMWTFLNPLPLAGPHGL